MSKGQLCTWSGQSKDGLTVSIPSSLYVFIPIWPVPSSAAVEPGPVGSWGPIEQSQPLTKAINWVRTKKILIIIGQNIFEAWCLG